MPERIYELSTHTDIIVFFGVNNANLYLLKNLFPQVRMVGRGHAIKVEGDEENVNLVMQSGKYGKILYKIILRRKLGSRLWKGYSVETTKNSNLILHGLGYRSCPEHLISNDWGYGIWTNDLVFAIKPCRDRERPILPCLLCGFKVKLSEK